MKDIQALVLAAGSASRMGKPKQLLRVGGRSILEHTIVSILPVEFKHIIAVIGNKKDKIMEEIKIKDPRFNWVINEAFQEGQSTSLKIGIRSFNEPTIHVMIFLGDLPFIKQDTIEKIFQAGREKLRDTNSPFTIRPVYQGTVGHPVFFGNMSSAIFEPLSGDLGAKPIMKEIPEHLTIALADQGILFDIDTINDFHEAKAAYHRNRSIRTADILKCME